MKNTKYTTEVWDIQFYKVDEDGNELLNEDGSVKLFTQSRDIDLSWVSDSVCDDAIESQKNNLSDAQINLLASAWNRIQQG